MDKIVAIAVAFIEFYRNELALLAIVLLGIGIVRIFQNIRSIKNKLISSDDFAAKLNEYLTSQGVDYHAYSWLIQKSPRFQAEMGFYGIIPRFYIPFSQIEATNYPVILNAIPAIHEEFGYDTRNDAVIRKYGNVLFESILRHRGDSLTDLEDNQKKVRNPFQWLREGLSWAFLLPFSVLKWIGFLGDPKLDKIEDHPLLSFVVNISTLLSSIVTIVVGWETFVNILKALFP